MRKLTEIIVHCTATVEGKDFTVADIRSWHKARGWKDIGYHRVIYRDGSVHDGRPIEQVGSHVAGRNSTTIGVVYVGGVNARLQPKDTRTLDQVTSLRDELARLLAKYPSISLISGHRDYAAKACPCFDARAEYASLLQRTPPPHPTTAAIGEGIVTASKLRLRAGPSESAPIVESMPKHMRVLVHAQDGDWIAVRSASGTEGWAARRYVKIAA